MLMLSGWCRAQRMHAQEGGGAIHIACSPAGLWICLFRDVFVLLQRVNECVMVCASVQGNSICVPCTPGLIV